MTITYNLAPIPKWVLIKNDGTVAGGGKLYTYSSLNKSEEKAVYQDPGGTDAYTNPILFDLNGVQGPFYWAVNDAALDDTYYLKAFDSDNNLLWDMDGYHPTGSGGGGSTTTYVTIKNYITNNQFIDNVGDVAGSTSLPVDLLLAPSNHKGFTPVTSVPIVGDNGTLGPDIRFVKNNTSAADNIYFPLFALADYPLTGAVTPVQYVRYQCTSPGTSEAYKSFQFPITQKVKNLSNTSVTFGIWARVAATPVDIKVYTRQYFGSGTAASTEVRLEQANFSLTTDWDWYTTNFTVPSVSGKSLGTPGLETDDDALYIQVEMPLDLECDIYFIKPALYLGTLNNELEFENYDQIDSIDQTPRTGDIKIGYYPTTPRGWVLMNDTSIGNVSSGADTEGAYTFQLYKTLWDGVSNTWAPVSSGRGATALADFLAGKTLTLPRTLGRAIAQAGTGSGLTARDLGEWMGDQANSIVAANLPDHLHDASPANFVNTGSGGVFSSGGSGGSTGVTGGITGFTSVTPFNVMQPTTFMQVYIKL